MPERTTLTTDCGFVTDPAAGEHWWPHGPLLGLRVHAASPNVQGVVVKDPGCDYDRVRVKWDDGDDTWSRRDLLLCVSAELESMGNDDA